MIRPISHSIGSLGAGFVSSSNQGYDLIAARVVIGFGAALLFTNSSAILTNAFAPYGMFPRPLPLLS
jgi:MFS family permease